MARTNLKNEFQKYWHPEFKDWHENIKGVYHVSSIGNNHQDLDFDDHSGPCLRQTSWEYTDPLPNSDATEGNLEEGKDHHKKLQKIIKAWKPNTTIEDALAKIFERHIKDSDKTRKILLVGSIDVLYKHLFNLLKHTSKTKKQYSVWDIKTASDYTLPKDKRDKNPTHFDQCDIYGALKMIFDLNPDHNEMVGVKIIYINKHNKATHIQREKFNLDEAVDKLGDCVDRAFYLDECLEKGVLPVAEPMHWCKYCKYLKRCIAVGDVEPVYKKTKAGKDTKVLRGLKVKDE